MRLNRKRCDPSDHLQESPGAPGPKSQNNLKKRLFGGSAKKSPKIAEKIKKHPKCFFFNIFFGYFRGFFLQIPKKTHFEIFFAILGPEGPETPANGCLGRNACVSEWILKKLAC